MMIERSRCQEYPLQIPEKNIANDNIETSPKKIDSKSLKFQENGSNEESPIFKKNKKVRKSKRNTFQFSSTMILEDQYFVEDEQSKEEENFERYSNDITKLKSYNMPFRFNQFFEFFFYHFIYFTLLGPLTVLITRFRGKKLGLNLQFVGRGRAFYIQLANFSISIITLFFYLFFHNPTIDGSIYLFNLIAVIMLRCFQIATKYATFDPLKIKIYREVEIKRADLTFDLFLADWSTQSDKIIYEQLYFTQRFFDTDPNLFFIQFMVEPSQKTTQQILESQKKMEYQCSSRVTHKKPNPIGFGIDTQIYHNGYTIVHFLITQHQQKSQSLRKTFEYIIKGFSFIRGLIPAIYGLAVSSGKAGLGMFWNEYVINLLLSSQVYTLLSALCLQIGFGLLDLRRKLIILEELTYMLIPRKIGITGANKVLPTINILKKESLKGWSILRKSIMQYGVSYTNRVESLIAVLSIYTVICIALIVLTYFKVINLNIVLCIEFSYDCIILIAMVFLMLLWGASLNQTFSAQIKNLHNNKIFIQDLLLVSNTYINEGKVSNNFLYNKALLIIQQNLADDQSTQEYINDLLEYYDQIIDELQYDEQNYPYTIFGIKVTSVMLKSIFAALVSVGASVFLDYINKNLKKITNISSNN